jgi:ureidoglycolate lyase
MPVSLPLVSTVMERHRHSSQAFLPLDVERYVVVVAPHGSAGGPAMAGARAFLVPGHTGISYAADCWHHPMIILDRPGSFAVILSRSGTAEDIETIALDEPIEIVE